MQSQSKHKEWVFFSLQNNLFSVPASQVQTMIETPTIECVPKLPQYYRGVINLRGKVIPLIDLRMRLAMPNLFDEMYDLLANREKDHRNWVNELEKSVQEGKEFRLTTDPHKCAFGKWYDTYKANNLMIDSMLKKFDIPHKNIHAIAEKVKRLEHEGKKDETRKVIDSVRNGELAEMIKLFSEFKECFAQEMHEIAVVFNLEAITFAITVDAIVSVGRIEDCDITGLDDLSIDFVETGIVTAVAKNRKNNQLTMILEPGAIIA